MKKQTAFILFSLLIAAPVFAAEPAAFESISAAMLEKGPASDSFGLIVKSNGSLVAKPGPVFSEGTDVAYIALPYLISTPQAISYPAWAVRQGWEGKFVVALEILPNGSVGRTHVMKSTGHRLLDNAAMKAIPTWKFQPATQNGKPVLTCIQIPVSFELK